MAGFLDLEIYIAPLNNHGVYSVRIKLDTGEDASGIIPATILELPITGDPQADGQVLFNELLKDKPLSDMWAMAKGKPDQRRIRLFIGKDAPELYGLPWESLYDDGSFITANAATPFSRYLEGDTPWGGLITDRPIKIISVVPEPSNLEKFGLQPVIAEEEHRLLEQAIGDLAPKHFQITRLEAPVTLERLEQALKDGYHVLHFVGHGKYKQTGDSTLLYLETNDRATNPVDEGQLLDMLRRQNLDNLPSLIFLAACQSAKQNAVYAFSGLAPKLLSLGIPSVVAMRDLFWVKSEQQMTPTFYKALARHGMVDLALNEARSGLLTAKRPDVDIPTLYMRLLDGKVWEPLWVGENPYKGLAAFTEDDAKYFFGREKLVEKMKQHLRSKNPRFLAVVGASGSGKSSVVQAGLIPALRRGELPESRKWEIVTIRPGKNPYEALEARGITDLSCSQSQPKLVLYIDQFEELFVECDQDIQQRFLDDLESTITNINNIIVILALRADFYGYVTKHSIGTQFETNQVVVSELNQEELKSAITEPANENGLSFDTGLPDVIVNDLSHAKNQLPLLQSTLEQLWYLQKDGNITYDSYVSIGRVTGALAFKAEEAFLSLSEDERLIARRIFTRLVNYGEGDHPDTRKTCWFEELLTDADNPDHVRYIVRGLANSRLLVTDDVNGNVVVELVHDVLLLEWRRFDNWINAHREFLLWRQRLNNQLRIWHSSSESDDALLRGALLIEANQWCKSHDTDLNIEETRYIEVSEVLRRRMVSEETRKAEVDRKKELRYRQRLRIALAIALMFLILTGIGFFTAKYQANEANSASLRYLSQARLSRSRELATIASNVDDIDIQLMLSRESALQTWRNPFDLSGDEYITTETRDQLLNAIYNAQHSSWRSTIGKPVIHRGDINSVAISPDAKYVATASDDNSIGIWNAKSGQLQNRITGHTDRVLSVSFSHDGEYVASGSWDTTIRVWDVQSGIEIKRLMGHEDVVNTIAFSPDDRYLASGSRDYSVRLWDLKTGEQLYIYEAHMYPIESVMFSMDGNWLISASQESVYIWDCRNGQPVSHISVGDLFFAEYISAITYDRVDKSVLIGDSNGTIIKWNPRTPTESEVIIESSGAILELEYISNGEQLVYKSNNQIYIVDANTSKVLHVIQDDTVYGNIFATYNADLIVSVDGCGLNLWDAETATQVNEIANTHRHSIVSLDFTRDGNQIMSATSEGEIRLWATPLGELIQTYSIKDDIIGATITPNGKYIIGYGSAVTVFNSISGHVLHELRNEDWYIVDLVPSPDNVHFAATDYDNINIWNIEEGEIVRRLDGHEAEILSIAYSPDGTHIVSVGMDATIRVWDVQSGIEIQQTSFGTPWMESGVRYSPDGKYIAASLDSISIQILSSDTLDELVSISPFDMDVTSFMFFADGNLVLINGSSGLSLWETETGDYVRHVLDSEFTYAPAALSQNGYVATCIQGNNIRIDKLADTVFLVDALHENDAIYEFVPAIDSPYFAMIDAQNTIRISILPDDGAIETVSSFRINNNTVSLSPSGKYLVEMDIERTVITPTQVIRLYESQTGKLINEVLSPYYMYIMQFSPDESQFYGISTDNNVCVWRIENLSLVDCFEPDISSLDSISYAPNASHIAIGLRSGYIEIRASDTLKVIDRFEAQSHEIHDIAYSPDGSQLASCSSFSGSGIRIWDVDSLSLEFELPGPYSSVAYSPNGDYLIGQRAFSVSDKALYVWDAKTGSEIWHTGDLYSELTPNSFSSDSRYIAAISGGIGFVLSMESGDILHRFMYGNPYRGINGLFFIGNTPSQLAISYGGLVLSGQFILIDLNEINAKMSEYLAVNSCMESDDRFYIIEYADSEDMLVYSTTNSPIENLYEPEHLLTLSKCYISREPALLDGYERQYYGFDDYPAIEH